MERKRTPTKGRRLGSSRRKQLREMSDQAKESSILEEEPVASEIMEKVQDFFRECDKDQKGFLTRANMQNLKMRDLPCSAEELEFIFDTLDTDKNGSLTTEEFTTGLRQFLSTQTATREHRRRKTASRRVHMMSANLSLEDVDSEERKCFIDFMDQLGAENIFEDQSEIWKLWVKLRQDEPHLLGNLEEFLAKMTNWIKEARSEKATLELTLTKQVTERNREVQHLYEEMEQQIHQEKQRLQHELETEFYSLQTNQQAASSENQQLKQTNQDLETQLHQIHQQLQETHEHLGAMKSRVSQLHSEEMRQVLLR
ncbi:EF-hand calcium-binding domain-containing protein 4B [Alligator sinensis]|uniref:EF-hand calcium-binding domain-containing protein 4B n=1 Tax=Alligator sinensis TaxID=38654 RepID=A0A3Q0GPS3_ALLSI|nr:EF-hand calcium-binding domain-containing protein 4B [Alligator sinensis]XP_025061795.1 EF-hand calcium-binding domain-containing protein 4B [Alligator sinensis]